MKKTITQFSCDVCKRRHESKADETQYPEGWIRLNSLMLEATRPIEKHKMDICSKNCLFQMMMDEIGTEVPKTDKEILESLREVSLPQEEVESFEELVTKEPPKSQLDEEFNPEFREEFNPQRVPEKVEEGREVMDEPPKAPNKVPTYSETNFEDVEEPLPQKKSFFGKKKK